MNQTPPTEDTIDLKELFYNLASQWKIILFAIVVSFFIAFCYLFITTHSSKQLYAANALINLNHDQKYANLTDFNQKKQFLTNQIENIQSRLILDSVIQQNPFFNFSFSKIDDKNSNQKLIVKYSQSNLTIVDGKNKFIISNFEVPQRYLDQPLRLKISSPYFQLSDDKGRVLLKSRLNHDNQSINTNNFGTISIHSKDDIQQEYIIKILSLAAANKQIKEQLSVKETKENSGILELNYTNNDQQQALNILNSILINYDENTNIDPNSIKNIQKFNYLDKQISTTQQNLLDAEVNLKKFTQQHQDFKLPKESELYLNTRIGLGLDLINLQQNLENTLRQNSDTSGVVPQITRQINSQKQEITDQETQMQILPQLQQEYIKLMSQVEINQQYLINLLGDYKKLLIARSGTSDTVNITETLVSPVLSAQPKKYLILILSLFVGAFLGCLFALLRSIYQTGVKSTKLIEKELNIPVLGTLPLEKKTNNRVDNSTNNTTQWNELRNLRSNIQYALKNAPNKIISISSPSPKLNSSYIATHLAIVLAQTNKKVVLIDANLRNGEIAGYFNHTGLKGLHDYLLSTTSYAEIIQTTQFKGLDCIYSGSNTDNASELIDSEQFSSLLNQLSKEYDYIVINTPPILASTESVIISQYTNLNLLLAGFNQTPMQDLELSLERLKHVGTNLHGIILTDIPTGLQSYGYKYFYE